MKKKKHKKDKKRKKHKKNKDHEKDDEDLDNMLLQKLKGISEEPTQKVHPGKFNEANPRNSRRESSSESSADERNHHKIRRKDRDTSVEKYRSKDHKRKKETLKSSLFFHKKQ